MGTVVSAQYRLPHHLWVDYSVIGSTFDTYIGPIRVKIITPTRSSSSVAETVRPDVSGVPDDAWSPADEWSKTYAGFGTDNKTALLRIGLELSEGARTIPSYLPYPENPETEAQRSEKIGSITAACMDEWFTRIAEWTSVVTGEDVNPRHPVFDATVIGGGFEYWSGSSWQGEDFDLRCLNREHLQVSLCRQFLTGSPILNVHHWSTYSSAIASVPYAERTLEKPSWTQQRPLRCASYDSSTKSRNPLA